MPLSKLSDEDLIQKFKNLKAKLTPQKVRNLPGPNLTKYRNEMAGFQMELARRGL